MPNASNKNGGLLQIHADGLYRSRVGREGLDPRDVAGQLRRFAGLPERVDFERRGEMAHGYLNALDDLLTLAGVEEFYRDHARTVRDFVVVGIGGSSLGAVMLRDALCGEWHNLCPAGKRKGARLFTAENVDADSMRGLMDVVDWEHSMVNVVTKSGTTPETVANFMVILRDLRKRLGARWRRHVVVTTGEGPLQLWAQEERLPIFPVPPEVGGRFSVLTAVGLLPATFAGVRARFLLQGAREMARTLKTGGSGNPVLRLAVELHRLRERHGKSILVLMPYSNALSSLGDWFRQLWGESLGKRKDRSGKIVHAGQTPVKSLGAIDQHSQLQLYNEGPRDKTVLFVEVARPGRDLRIPRELRSEPAFSYLRGRSLHELLLAEKRGTEQALTHAGCPNATLRLERLDARALGGLLVFLEVLTTVSGFLYDVNPYDQPGVEAGKTATRRILSGYGR